MLGSNTWGNHRTLPHKPRLRDPNRGDAQRRWGRTFRPSGGPLHETVQRSDRECTITRFLYELVNHNHHCIMLAVSAPDGL
jgi:hypothetical protein